MSSIFSSDLWSGRECYVTSEADLLHHGFDPDGAGMGDTCLITFGSSLFKAILETLPSVDEKFRWPYSTTPVELCMTKSGKKLAIHFPSYGGTRIANSLEQLLACGIEYVFGLGSGGTPQENINIGDIVVLEGAIRGDGVSRYYGPAEFPAVADFGLTSKVRRKLDANNEDYHMGLSFGTDALYREEPNLIKLLKELGVLTVDLESSAFLTVGRRLGLKCCWVGVVSDRLVRGCHEGNIHSEHIVETLLRLSSYIIDIVEETEP